jgi:hypothetical protein
MMAEAMKRHVLKWKATCVATCDSPVESQPWGTARCPRETGTTERASCCSVAALHLRQSHVEAEAGINKQY